MTISKKREQGFSSTLVILVLLLVIGMAYVLLTQKNKSVSNTPSITPVATQSPDNSLIADVSSWTVYTNTTYGFSIKLSPRYSLQPGNEEQNTCIWLNSTSPCEILVNIYDNKDNLTLENYLNKNINSFAITGPLINYTFNDYDSLVNKNQPGTNLFIKRGLYVYRFVAPKASLDKEIEAMVATFKFTQ